MASLDERTPSRAVPRVLRLPLVARRALAEVGLIAFLYVAYCASRMLASDEFAPARGHALDILDVEKAWRIDVEARLNDLFVKVDWLGVAGSFWYATTHYLVTLGVLVWLWRRGRREYLMARRALVLATVVGLAFYLAMPTAPPRLVDGRYVDVLAMHQSVGWWGADASAPKGFGGWTNELAAFPSLHAGWALWVAIVLVWTGVPVVWRVLGIAYAVVMTVVIVGTGNHWLLDAVAGWAVVGLAWVVVGAVAPPARQTEEHGPAPG